MPHRDSFGNNWDNPLQAAFWDSGARPDACYRQSGEEGHANWDRCQPLAEEWAVREGRTDLYVHFRVPPSTVGQQPTDPSETRPSNAPMLNDIWCDREQRTFQRSTQEPPQWINFSAPPQQIPQYNWDSFRGELDIRTSVTPPTPIPPQRLAGHQNGGQILPTTLEPYLVHGWRFRTGAAARYFERLLDLSDEDDETIRAFRGMSSSRQRVYMENYPLPDPPVRAEPSQEPEELWNAPIQLQHGHWMISIPGTDPPQFKWGQSSARGAQFAANMVHRGIGDTNTSNSSNPIYKFLCYTQEQQGAYMRLHPEEGAPLNQYETTMLKTRDQKGRFRKKGPDLKNMIYEILHRAIVKPDKKGKKHDRDKIMKWAVTKGLAPAVYKCGKLGTWHAASDTMMVIARPEVRERWCTKAIGDHCISCGGSGQYYAQDGGFEFVRVSGMSRYVEIGWARENYNLWRNGTWHREREPETPEQRQERIRNSGTGEIPGYHSVVPEWRNGGALEDPTKLLFGIELEIRSVNRRMICTKAEEIGWVGEQDGSLCRQTGLEVVAKPESFEEISDPKGRWKTFLNEIRGKCRGWDAGKHYGMHISVSRQSMDQKHQIRFVCFFHDNTKLCEFIAGRSQNDYCKFYKKEKDISALRPESKYEAACVRGEHRIEVRIFRSTVSESGFMRNVEFTHSAVEFTKALSNSKTGEFSHEEFEGWLKNDSHKSRYPNLYEHMFMPDGKPRPPKSTKKDELPQIAPGELEAERQGSQRQRISNISRNLSTAPVSVATLEEEEDVVPMQDEEDEEDNNF